MLLLTYDKPVGLLPYHRREIDVGDRVYLHPQCRKTWPWNRRSGTDQRVRVIRVHRRPDRRRETAAVMWDDGTVNVYYLSDMSLTEVPWLPEKWMGSC